MRPIEDKNEQFDFKPGGIAQSAGSFISLFSCLFVIVTYYMFKPLQRHPSSLMFWMALFGFGFYSIFTIEFYTPNRKLACEDSAPISQFFLLGQEVGRPVLSPHGNCMTQFYSFIWQ